MTTYSPVIQLFRKLSELLRNLTLNRVWTTLFLHSFVILIVKKASATQ
jgi:hypothetical protein